MREPLTDSRTVTRERFFALVTAALWITNDGSAGVAITSAGARLGAGRTRISMQAVVDDQRHARRQLAGGVSSVASTGSSSPSSSTIGSSAPMRRGSATTAPAIVRTPAARQRARHRVQIAAAERRDRRCRAGRRRRRSCRPASAQPVSSVRKRQSAPSRISAVVVASTFWFDAGSISAPSRCEKNSRPVRASITRMPTRSRPGCRRCDDVAQRRLHAHDAVAIAIVGGRLGRVVGAGRA
jgi:hypothetical protein